MKLKGLLFTISFTLIYVITFAQEKDPVIKKGYYSIGNNAQKLVALKHNNTAKKDSFLQVQKGYYSIGNNNRKLPRSSGKTSIRPPEQKGFYSIEPNKGKLLN